MSLTAEQTKRISKRLSKALRHEPGRVGLTLDEGGWTPVADVLRALTIDRPTLDHVVRTNDKQRFTVDGDRIRANQGHSVPVDLGLVPVDPPAELFHGTVRSALAGIMASGLEPRARHHVHLSGDLDTARRVGARRGQPLILTVAAGAMHTDGHVFYRSANGVWLTDSVPPRYLSGM